MQETVDEQLTTSDSSQVVQTCRRGKKRQITENNLESELGSGQKRKKELKKRKCPYCPLEIRNLPRHLKTHTGEKNFICHICGTGFQQREHLDKHNNKKKNVTCTKV